MSSSSGTSANSEEWVDVLPLLKKAASTCLSDAKPLLAIDDLNLFDLMNAAELMDPKMDQCFNVSKPYLDDANTLKMSAYDITSHFVYEKNPELSKLLSAIKIFNWLLINENSCFEGAALLETLYYCKYTWLETWKRFDLRTAGRNITADCPEYADYLLVEYCKVLMMSMDHYTQVVVDADIFEDDDFQVLQPLPELKDSHLPVGYQWQAAEADSASSSSTAILSSMLAKGMNFEDMDAESIKGAVQDSQAGAAANASAGPAAAAVVADDDGTGAFLKPLADITSHLQEAAGSKSGDVAACLNYIVLLFRYRRVCHGLMARTRRGLGALTSFSSTASVRARANGVLSHKTELTLLEADCVELREILAEIKQCYVNAVLPLFAAQGLQGGIDEPVPEVEVLPAPLPTVMCHPPVCINNYTLDSDVQHAFHIGLVRRLVNFPIRVVKNTTNTTDCLRSALDSMSTRVAGSGKATDYQGLSFASSQLAVLEENADNLTLDELVMFLQERVSSATLHLLPRSYVFAYLRALLASKVTVAPSAAVSAAGLSTCSYSVATSSIVNSMCHAGIPRDFILYQKEGTHEWLGITQASAPAATNSYASSVLVTHVNKLVQYMCMSRAKLPLRFEATVFPYWGNSGAAAARGADYYCTQEDVDEVTGQAPDGALPKWDFFYQWMGMQLGTFMDIFMGLQIENGLVQTPELDYFFFYWDYLCNVKSFLIDQMKVSRASYEELFLKKTFDLKTRKLVTAKKMSVLTPPKYLPTSAELYVKARGQACRGYLRTMMICNALKVPQCMKFQSPFTSWEFRYWTRFKALAQCATASYLPYAEYMKAMEPYADADARSLLSTAVTCFSNVKQYQNARAVLAERQATDPNFPVYCSSPGSPAMQAFRKQMADAQWKLLLKLAIMNGLNLTNLGKVLEAAAVVSLPPAPARGKAAPSAPPAAAPVAVYNLVLDYKQDPTHPVCLLSVAETGR